VLRIADGLDVDLAAIIKRAQTTAAKKTAGKA